MAKLVLDEAAVLAIGMSDGWASYLTLIVGAIQNAAMNNQYPQNSGTTPDTDYRDQWTSGIEEHLGHLNGYVGNKDWHAIFTEVGFNAVARSGRSSGPSGRTEDVAGHHVMLRALEQGSSEIGGASL